MKPYCTCRKYMHCKMYKKKAKELYIFLGITP